MSNGGLKYDGDKPDMSMVSWELMEAVARVRMFGAAKYTRYGECDCVQNVESKNVIQNIYADLVTTESLKTEIQNINETSSKIAQDGLKNIENISQNITKVDLETIQQKDMGSPENKSTPYWTPVANSAEKLSEYVSTTAIIPVKYEEHSAQPVMSVSVGLKNQSGSIKHKPTCGSLKVVRQGRDNWKLGFKLTRSCAAALRHIFKFLSGETLDPESNLPHLAHAVCCLEHALYDMVHRPENDDRYGQTKNN